jgi:hypothetical protein
MEIFSFSFHRWQAHSKSLQRNNENNKKSAPLRAPRNGNQRLTISKRIVGIIEDRLIRLGEFRKNAAIGIIRARVLLRLFFPVLFIE